MEVPLTPLEFARRTRRLHGHREAVVDGDLRLTYEQFFDRCDRWSAALQGLGVAAGRPGGHDRAEHPRAAGVLLRGAADRRGAGADQLPPHRRTTSSTSSTTAVHRSCASTRTTWTRWTGSAARCRTCGTSWPSRAAAGTAGWTTRRRSRRLARTSAGRRDRRAGPADDQLHQRHHRPPEGRDDHPPERGAEHDRHPAAPADRRWASGTCGRCRCSTPTAGPSPGRSPPPAGPTSACARSTRRGVRADPRRAGRLAVRRADGADLAGQRAPADARGGARRGAGGHRRRAARGGHHRAAGRASSAGRSPRSTGSPRPPRSSPSAQPLPEHEELSPADRAVIKARRASSCSPPASCWWWTTKGDGGARRRPDAGRDRRPRQRGHGRLLPRPRGDRSGRWATAGSTPATPPWCTPTATSRSATGSRT